MDTLCGTRPMKVLKYLHRTVPDAIPRASIQALAELPPRSLASLHAGLDTKTVIEDIGLKDWLLSNPVPAPAANISGPLFHGTLVFARMIYSRAGQPDFSISAADTQTAATYAALAAVPIQRYASQYGSNSLAVSTTVIPFNVTLGGTPFTDSDLQGWVEQIAQIARANQIDNPCVVVLHDRSGTAGPTAVERNAYHSITDGGTPYCFCLVFGQNLSVADNNQTFGSHTNEKAYAHILSHEIAEMVVDPRADVSNPEVCDACAGNCNNDLFDLFDQNGVYMGGTADTATASGFAFFINSVVRPDAYDAATECVLPGADPLASCVYPPPLAWGGQGPLTTVGNPVSIAGHYSSGDQRYLVVVGTSQGKIHEIFWHPGMSGIEGEDDLPVAFDPGTVVSVGSIYNSDQQRHVVLVGTTAGKVHEIYWKPETVGIEGHDDLPVDFGSNSIVAVSGLYDPDEQRHLVIVGTTAGTVREIYWKADTVGIEGQDDLPVSFASGSIVGVASIYNSDQKRYVVVVGTDQGKLHEVFWKSNTVGVEGHDDLPVDFGANSISAVAGFYDSNRKRYVIAVGTSDGTLYQVHWKDDTVGIEARSTIAKLQGPIVGVAGFYGASEDVNHIVVALANGELKEFWMTPDL